MAAVHPPTFCESCGEDVQVNRDGACAWCGGALRPRKGKRLGVYGKLSDDQLRILHAMHDRRGTSIRELARAVIASAGYASEHSALEGIRTGWRRLGLKARAQGEATRRANEARRAEGSPGTADRAVYKRYRRLQAGGYRRCAGVKLNAPGKGRRCRHYAAPGSDFCRSHDPEKRAQVVAIVDAARARIRPEAGR